LNIIILKTKEALIIRNSKLLKTAKISSLKITMKVNNKKGFSTLKKGEKTNSGIEAKEVNDLLYPRGFSKKENNEVNKFHEFSKNVSSGKLFLIDLFKYK
jgi:hypothetical protein